MNLAKQGVYIFGAGGHAKVIGEIFSLNGIEILAYVTPNKSETSFNGSPLLSEDQFFTLSDTSVFVAIGENSVRSRVVEKIKQQKPQTSFPNAIHPSAVVSGKTNFGFGIAVMAGVLINPGVQIEDFVVVNTGSIVEHDSKLKRFCFLGPGSRLGGNVEVGEFSFVGIGASVIQGVHIGKTILDWRRSRCHRKHRGQSHCLRHSRQN